jgi:hypothetical protein
LAATIEGVDREGRLLVAAPSPQAFRFGEVEWIIN